MFSQDLKVAEAQKVMLSMLLEVHKICEKHHLTYWLDGGTLLGAVRHNGFIPWDDDMDIAMPIEDYKKFLEIAPKELPPDVFLQYRRSDPLYPKEMTKLRKNNTTLIEIEETGDEKYHHGIFIDIFAYQYYEKWWLDTLMWCRDTKDLKNKYKKHTLKRALITLYTNIIMYLPTRIVKHVITFYINKIAQNRPRSIFTYSTDSSFKNYTKTKDMQPVKLSTIDFEGYYFFVPHNPDAVLKEWYGDYMKLPPIEERRVHSTYIDPFQSIH